MVIDVIIPAINEEKSLPGLINYLIKNGEGKVRVVVADGGSTDNTVEYSQSAGATVLQSPEKGRARQMNFGAQFSESEILYFVHADTYPPESFVNDILTSINHGYSAGCFRLSFDYEHPALKFYCWFTRFDINLFRFGDQTLFIKRDLFEKVERFDEKLIVMEDQEIVRSIKKISKFAILPKNVSTSARKYQQVGVYKLQLIFTCVLVMYYLGFDHQKIVDFYVRKIR